MDTVTSVSTGTEYVRNNSTGEVTVNGEHVGIVTSTTDEHGNVWWSSETDTQGAAFTTAWRAVRFIARSREGRSVQVTAHELEEN